MDVKSAQEQFYAALDSTQQIVKLKRKARTGYVNGTQEMIALTPDTPVPDRPNPRRASQLRIRVPTSEMTALREDVIAGFEAHLTLLNRLLKIQEEQGEIVCMGPPPEAQQNGGTSFCEGIKSLWTRSGKAAPQVVYCAGPLDSALTSQPVAVFIRLEDAPKEPPLGYLQVQLSSPDVCILFRRS